MRVEVLDDSQPQVALWKPVLFSALAGGMAWGIRGQYGHETGAMLAGLLVSLVLVLLFCPHWRSLAAARAVALCTVAMGFGGTMTYGQTLGLTQDPELIGNWAALCWGLLGTSVKGAIWIGFAGVFLGMGLGGTKYRWREMFVLMFVALGAYHLGILILNSPFDPAEKMLPAIYFSASPYWQPDVPIEKLKPRPEAWGGLLCSLAVVMAYAGAWRKDRLALNLGLWGLLGGALGFPLGQCLQAYHAWNREIFHQGIWATLDPHMNWWNMMETTFGTVMGATLGLGLWLNRRRVRQVEDLDADAMPLPWEWALIAIHVCLLLTEEFLAPLRPELPLKPIEMAYDLGLIMGIIPLVGIINGRRWPYMMALPITLIVYGGKTVLELVYEKPAIGAVAGWTLYLVIPMLIATAAAVWFMRAALRHTGSDFARPALLICTWIYFCLNYAFFGFPWPWADWTSRTPNGIIFTVCALALTALVFMSPKISAPSSPEKGRA